MSGQQADETRLALTAHEPLVLDGPPALFLIEEGSVAVFHAEVRGGQPVGPRRLLSRATSGRALLRVPHEGEDGLRFVVVAVQGATLREVRGPEGSPSAAWSADAIDGWIDLVAPSPDEARRPKLVTTVEPGRVLDLDDGECVAAAPGSSTWCRVAEGRADWLGDASVHLGARRGWVPLPPGAWIRARGPAQIETAAVGDLKGRSTRTEGLSWLHARILDRLAEGERVRAQREFERLQSRERLDAQGLEGALQELASVLQTGSRRGVLAEPLLAAMSMVGERIGVTVRPAAESEGAGQRSDPVEAIARASRVRVRRVKLRGRWWRRDCGPLLAFAGERGERPLALLRGRWMGYEAHDPADGSIRRVDARLAQELGGEAVAMCRPLPEGALRLPDLVRFSLSRSYVDLVFALATGVVATLLGMITPQATAILMDQAIPDANQRLVLEIGAGLIAAALGITIFNLAQGIVLLRIGVRTESDSQAALWDRLLRLRSNFFRRFSTGDLQSRIMAVNQIAQEVSGRTLGAVFSSFLALLNLGLLYYYSARLSLLALALGGVVMLTTSGTGVLLRRDIRELMDREGRLFGLVIQLIGGVGKLRVAGASGRAFTRWLSDYAAQLGLWARILRRRQGLLLFNTVLPILSSIALFALSHALLSEGRASGQAGGLTLGSFLAFNVAYNTFLGGVTSLSNTLVGFLDLVAKGERTRPILEEVPEVDQSKADPGRLGGQVTVEGVGFRYREDGPWILSGVDLRAEPGEFIAVVGASGSGKSTLFRLLLGFETPMAGRVAFDGQDLAHLDVVAVRRQLGVVLQNGRLDAGSIYDNLAGGGILSLDEAWAAAEAAGMAEEIREMPMGMHTVLSVGGSNLSGGQRQRLLIARALAHRPRVLLFDEATSALDNRTQAVVSESLERLRVTRIVIAHRLSTIRNADRIYVLEAGRIAQAGAFRELMEDPGGLFARMMTRQMA